MVVLLDNKMPKVSGLEVLKTMKADERLKLIPVVVLTSSRETPDLIEFYKHGANAYVVKPVDFSEFMKAVRQVGVFWAAVNEPPPDIGSKELLRSQTVKTFLSERKRVKMKTPLHIPHLQRMIRTMARSIQYKLAAGNITCATTRNARAGRFSWLRSKMAI